MTNTNRQSPFSAWRSWGQVPLDVALAGFATVAAVTLNFEVIASRGTGSPFTVGGDGMYALGVAAIYGGSLLVRRFWPLTVLGIMLVAAVFYGPILGFPVFMLGPGILIAIYTVASLLPRDRSLWALLIVEIALLLLVYTGSTFPGEGSVALFALLIASAWFLGDLARRWRTAAELHEARATELAAAREELARRAVGEERLRIARELHDVVAHSMTVVALQAGSGRLAANQDPQAAQTALETIEHSSREALADMRRLVGVLREGEEAATQPTPGLADIDRLVEDVGRAGVEVDVTRKGRLDQVSTGLALAVYRIAQEALTNVVRHSGAQRADLGLEAANDGLTLIVENGPATAPPDDVVGGGHGLAGMRERVSLYGGTLQAGPREDGGYRVEAWFPADVAAG